MPDFGYVLGKSLAYGAIVAVSEDGYLFVTWNGSQTFNVWGSDGSNVDCFTRECGGLYAATDAAYEWLNDIGSELDEDDNEVVVVEGWLL